MQRARRSSGRALRTGTARVLWPEIPGRTLAPGTCHLFFLAMKVTHARWRRSLPIGRSSISGNGPGNGALTTDCVSRCSLGQPRKRGVLRCATPCGDQPLRAVRCGRCRDGERFRKLRHPCGARRTGNR